jgi:hypothetical protein
MSSADGLKILQQRLKDDLAEANERARGRTGVGAMADELLRRDRRITIRSAWSSRARKLSSMSRDDGVSWLSLSASLASVACRIGSETV